MFSVMSGVGQWRLLMLLSLFLADAFASKSRPVYTSQLFSSWRVRGAGCGRRGGAGLAVGVMSALQHAAARREVRDTWARHAARLGVSYAFVLGTPTEDLADELAAEATEYKDLVFGSFSDTYQNLTLKSLSLLEWGVTRCRRARWLLKTDDDVFVNIIDVVRFVSNLDRVTDNNTIYGKVRKDMPVDRYPTSIFYVSRRQYPQRLFPPFCRGLGYLLPLAVARRLLVIAPHLPYIPLEDVFITGVLAEVVGLHRQNIKSFRDEKEEGPTRSNEPMLLAHAADQPARMRVLWSMLKHMNKPPQINYI